jgi:hypothetical protein
MSDARFSTEELVDWADNILDGLGPEMKRLSMNGDNDGFGKAAKDADMLNTIIARLRAADSLCEAAKEVLSDSGPLEDEGWPDQHQRDLWKAIADYEEE